MSIAPAVWVLPINKDLNGYPYENRPLCSTGHELVAVKLLNIPALPWPAGCVFANKGLNNLASLYDRSRPESGLWRD